MTIAIVIAFGVFVVVAVAGAFVGDGAVARARRRLSEPSSEQGDTVELLRRPLRSRYPS
jgi:hypothetical protein